MAAKLVANLIFLRARHRSLLLLSARVEDINLQTLRGIWFQHGDASVQVLSAIIQMKGFLNVG